MAASEMTLAVVKTALVHDAGIAPEARTAILRILAGRQDARECSPREAMAILRATPRTFWRRIQTGAWPLTRRRVNRKVVRFRLEEVEKLAQAVGP